MANAIMAKKRLYLHCSSSIINFREKLLKRTGLDEYHPVKNLTDKVLFFGLYHKLDYLRFMYHLGCKTVFWCGSDILNLRKADKVSRGLVRATRARHICENTVEWNMLRDMGINAEIHPMIFDYVKIPMSFEPSKNPHVYTTCHEGREKDYRVDLIEKIAPLFPVITFHIYGIDGEDEKNIVYHGRVLESVFMFDIQGYQAALRLNKFDGFSEILAKSALMGQYPISWISYPHITHVHDATSLRLALQGLSKKKEPNVEGRNYWRNKLTESLYAITN